MLDIQRSVAKKVDVDLMHDNLSAEITQIRQTIATKNDLQAVKLYFTAMYILGGLCAAGLVMLHSGPSLAVMYAVLGLLGYCAYASFGP